MQGQSIGFPSSGDKPPQKSPVEDEVTYGRNEVASYVCDMTGNLKKLALEADLKFLAYLIDMAHIEAFNAMQANGRKADDADE